MVKKLTEEEYDRWLKLTRKSGRGIDWNVIIAWFITKGVQLFLLILTIAGIKWAVGLLL